MSILLPLNAAALGHSLPTLAMILVASAWQGIALVLLAALALRLLPSLGAAVRSTFWTAILILAALLPLTRLLPSHATVAGVANHAVWHVTAGLSVALAMVWLGASTFRLTQFLFSAHHLYTLLRSAVPLQTTPANAALLGDGRHPIELCTSPQVDRPSVAGFLRPRILIPTALLAELSETDLRHILLHEREHLHRGDHWVNLLGQLTLVLFPLSPAFLWLDHRLALERELACDDSVLLTTAAPKAYAACLARVAEGSLLHRGLTLAVGVLGGKRRSELSLRVERILRAPVAATGNLQTRFAMAALCVALLGGSAMLAHSPELISFSPANNSTSFAAIGNGIPILPLATRFASSAEPRPTLEKAIMPQAAVSTFYRSKAVTSRQLTSRKRAAAGRSAAPRVVLTSFRDHVSPGPQQIRELHLVPVLLRITPVAFNATPAWFTAVQTPDGWILVQI